MNQTDQVQLERTASSDPTWTTPISEGRQRPTSTHAPNSFSYYLGDDCSPVPSWDFNSQSLQQTPTDHATSSRPQSMHQELYRPAIDNGYWNQKPSEETLDFQSLDRDGPIGQAYTTDEVIPILDLYQNMPEHEPTYYDPKLDPRRMSGSSFTMSSSDIPSYDDFSAAMSEAPSFGSDYPPLSNRTSLMSSTHLSPVASPRLTPQGRSELVRTQSRGRGASPSPRPGVRSAPYNVENSRTAKRWSTGSYGPQARRQVPYMHNGAYDFMASSQAQQPYLMASAPVYQRNSMLLPSQLPSQLPSLPSQTLPSNGRILENPPPLLSHGLFRMLQSNADAQTLHGHYADLSDPPDLFASLQEEQIPPPPEDMDPEDPDMKPHEQELRFEGDLYTPRWVRGHGNKREGWCGICKPGRWLVLKNSAFWYDKSFTHGISAATGSPFQEPQDSRRMDGNPDVWEGLCGSCNEWIALVSSKKKGTTWFRHAYKCHSHPKVKDTPKRRRESGHIKAPTGPYAPNKPSKPEQQLSTPQMTPTVSIASCSTPTSASMRMPPHSHSHAHPHPHSHPHPHPHPHPQVTSQPRQQMMQTPIVPPPLFSATLASPQIMEGNEPFPNMI